MVLKRIIVTVLLIASLVGLVVIPASAYSEGNTTMYYSVLPFQYIGFGTNYRNQDNWLADRMRVGNSAQFGNEFESQVVECWNNGRITNEIYTSAGNRSFQLSMFDQVVNVNLLSNNNSYNISFGLDSDLPGSVEYQGTLLVYELIGNTYTPQFYRFQGVVNTTGGTAFIGREIANAIKAVTSKPIVLLTEFRVTAVCNYDEFDGIFYVDSAGTSIYFNVQRWASQFNMTHETVIQVDPADPTDVSFIDWISVAVGGFFDFQLWPGMTLGEVIEFILVFGLVLWFLTMVI